MSDLTAAMLGTLMVGIGDDIELDDGVPVLRVYIDSRYLNRYVLVQGEEAIARARSAWAGGYASHTFIYPPPPASAIYQDETEYEKRDG